MWEEFLVLLINEYLRKHGLISCGILHADVTETNGRKRFRFIELPSRSVSWRDFDRKGIMNHSLLCLITALMVYIADQNLKAVTVVVMGVEGPVEDEGYNSSSNTEGWSPMNIEDFAVEKMLEHGSDIGPLVAGNTFDPGPIFGPFAADDTSDPRLIFGQPGVGDRLVRGSGFGALETHDTFDHGSGFDPLEAIETYDPGLIFDPPGADDSPHHGSGFGPYEAHDSFDYGSATNYLPEQGSGLGHYIPAAVTHEMYRIQPQPQPVRVAEYRVESHKVEVTSVVERKMVYIKEGPAGNKLLHDSFDYGSATNYMLEQGSGLGHFIPVVTQGNSRNHRLPEQVVESHPRGLSGMVGVSGVRRKMVYIKEEPARNRLDVNSTNTSGRYEFINVTKISFSHVLCGLPPFLDCKDQNVTNSTSLSRCERLGSTVIFITATLIGGVLTMVGNSLVPLVLILQKTYRSRHNYIKGSLAVVDMLVGSYMLFCVLPNTIWIRRETQDSVLDYVLGSDNTPESIVLGALFMLTKQASTLHLLLLSAERFVAIKWPLWHHGLRTRSVFIPILALWVFCIMEACLPAMLKQQFAYQFNSLVLAHFLVVRRSYDSPNVHGTVYAVVTVLLPYLITVALIALTAGVARNHLRGTKDLVGGGSLPSTITKSTVVSATDSSTKPESVRSSMSNASKMPKRRLKPEVAVLKTTSLMILAFTLSMIPVTVVFLLHIFGYYDCYSYALPYFITFYITVANSLSNVIIYSARDKKFCEALTNLFGRTKKSIIGVIHA